jgi:hypothetical protein
MHPMMVNRQHEARPLQPRDEEWAPMNFWPSIWQWDASTLVPHDIATPTRGVEKLAFS